MSAELIAGIVRILDLNGQTAGAGFVLTDDGLIATCAHVVESAGAGPGENVRLVFHLTGNAATAIVEPEGWRNSDAEDVSILQLEERLPKGVIPLLLSDSTGAEGQIFSTFGFPDAKPFEGMVGKCEVIGHTTERGFPVLQLRSSEIRPGFSGAPVWDEVRRIVIGIVVSILPPDLDRPMTETAFIIPSETLQSVWPDLKLTHPTDPRYERLRKAYISPDSVFKRVELDNNRFTGRQWLIDEVDSFLQKECGYFILEADAGLGKTAFLAHLVQNKGYVHHFAERARGTDDVISSLCNLAVQLILKWELDPDLIDGICISLSHAPLPPDFLYNLLTKAAQKRDETRPGEKIVVVIDALDEVRVSTGHNVLMLPSVLPRGVYFIVSQRPVAVPLQVEVQPWVFRLKAGDQNNLADMRTYLEAAATWPGIIRELQTRDYTPMEFVEALLYKCQGVWIYLHYVVSEIERGGRSPLDLDKLPDGVRQYYVQYWNQWRDEDKHSWNKFYRPLLATLAAAQQEVTILLLSAWTGFSDEVRLHELLKETWRPFLTSLGQGEDRIYFYHASLQEFFTGQVKRDDLTTSEKNFIEELVDATRRAHSDIANYYLSRWGGMNRGLRRLRHLTDPDFLDRYGLSHLTSHLEKAERNDALHRLLALEWLETEEVLYYPDQGKRLRGWLNQILKRRQSQSRIVTKYRNSWHTTKEQIEDTTGYQADIERAWGLVEASGLQSPIAIGYQCRYALIVTSLNSLAANIPPRLLATLVEKRRWTPMQALTYAHSVPDPTHRVETLVELTPYLPETKKEETFREALVVARTIGDRETREDKLTYLVSRAIEYGYPKEAFVAALELPDSNSGIKEKILTVLAPYLAEQKHFKEALRAIEAIRNRKQQTEVLIEVASHLPEDFIQKALVDWQKNRGAQAALLPRLAKLGYLEEAISRFRQLFYRNWNEDLAIEVIDRLTCHLPETLRWEMLSFIWTLRIEVLVNAVVKLAPCLTKPQLREVMGALLELPGQQFSPFHERINKSKALAELVPWLAESGYLQEAFTVAEEIKNKRQRAAVLVKLISQLGKWGDPQKALEKTRELPEFALGYDSPRATALIELATTLTTPSLIQEAFTIVRQMQHAGSQAKALAGLASYLPKSLLSEAMDIARGIEREDTKAEVLTNLLPRLPKDLVLESLEIAKKTRDRRHQATILSALIPRLAELDYPLEEVLATTRLIRHTEHLAEAQSTLIYYHPAEMLAKVLVDLAPVLATLAIRWHSRGFSGCLHPIWTGSRQTSD